MFTTTLMNQEAHEERQSKISSILSWSSWLSGFKSSSFIVVVGAILMAASMAAAQPPALNANETLVTGAGSAVIRRRPEIARVHVVLSGEGKTLKEAVARLKERHEGARKKLMELGAAEAAITTEEIQVESVDQRAQMERMMRMRMRSSGGRPATGPSTQLVKVNMQIKAEWPLKAESIEELLVAAEALRTKVQAADIGQNKTASLEEQEAREEAAAESNDGAVAPGEPYFLFVAKISAADRATALAEAFQKARANAQALARAAGAELGTLKQISAQGHADLEQMQMEMMYRRRGYAAPAPALAEADEASSNTPGSVTMQMGVSASFSLKP